MVFRIAQSTSSRPDRPQAEKELSFLKYTDYYPVHAQATSFGLELEDGTLGGCVLCEPDPDKYFRILARDYAARMEALLPGSYDAFLEAQDYIREFGADYPAHLHINVSPAAQNLGAGSRLMDRLVQELEARGVPGVCLGMQAGRSQAVHFYRKNGFSVLKDTGDTLFMGRKLNPARQPE